MQTTCGTFAYMSPEMLNNKEPTAGYSSKVVNDGISKGLKKVPEGIDGLIVGLLEPRLSVVCHVSP